MVVSYSHKTTDTTQMQLKGFQACILVNDVELNQYGIETSPDGNEVSCWVPSEAGKVCFRSIHDRHMVAYDIAHQKFTVRWQDTGSRDVATAGYVYLDGISCGARCIESNGNSDNDTAEQWSARTSATTAKPFMFSSIEYTGNLYILPTADHAY